MKTQYTFDVIARVRTPFGEKFGIPRQSGLAAEVSGEIIFEEAFRSPEALRGIEGFSHIWLVWCFSQHAEKDWQPTVRPPRLDGSTRLGVFATRSSFRPNPIGLSLVRLDGVDYEAAEGPILKVSGPDLLDGTPLFDIKPYLPYTDCRPEARSGFVTEYEWTGLAVEIPPDLLVKIPPDQQTALREVLAQDPRPAYHRDPERIYGLSFAGRNVRFTVQDGIARVIEVDAL
ncbi:MAG: tRNA (N6-threonylcarbamoyladenosine(37)-N6)-methyltransferase TrmO [Clostridiaceae bacterium]|jgi:tRNA-Thr(GGU) m(6)t(6)A37 methyltransferase TsaA|nr:tRNA (N6-threonylcarbamoyladenosine(37)-N6)-methyltransferase TrmO [Clostridiaceae bacterium]